MWSVPFPVVSWIIIIWFVPCWAPLSSNWIIILFSFFYYSVCSIFSALQLNSIIYYLVSVDGSFVACIINLYTLLAHHIRSELNNILFSLSHVEHCCRTWIIILFSFSYYLVCPVSSTAAELNNVLLSFCRLETLRAHNI